MNESAKIPWPSPWPHFTTGFMPVSPVFPAEDSGRVIPEHRSHIANICNGSPEPFHTEAQTQTIAKDSPRITLFTSMSTANPLRNERFPRIRPLEELPRLPGLPEVALRECADPANCKKRPDLLLTPRLRWSSILADPPHETGLPTAYRAARSVSGKTESGHNPERLAHRG